jgi:hypothetical protein
MEYSISNLSPFDTWHLRIGYWFDWTFWWPFSGHHGACPEAATWPQAGEDFVWKNFSKLAGFDRGSIGWQPQGLTTRLMVVLNHMGQNLYLKFESCLVGAERGPAPPLHGTIRPEPWAISSVVLGRR